MADDKNAKPEAEVSDKEAAALQGNAGPNVTPAFGKQPLGDENEPLVDENQLESIKEGSAAGSGPKEGSELARLLATQGVEETDGRVTYVSHIARLKIGQFQFDQGKLIVKPDEAKKFEKLLETAHPRTVQSIHKVDAKAGEAFAKKFRDQNESKLSRGVDTSEKASKSPAPSKS